MATILAIQKYIGVWSMLNALVLLVAVNFLSIDKIISETISSELTDDLPVAPVNLDRILLQLQEQQDATAQRQIILSKKMSNLTRVSATLSATLQTVNIKNHQLAHVEVHFDSLSSTFKKMEYKQRALQQKLTKIEWLQKLRHDQEQALSNSIAEALDEKAEEIEELNSRLNALYQMIRNMEVLKGGITVKENNSEVQSTYKSIQSVDSEESGAISDASTTHKCFSVESNKTVTKNVSVNVFPAVDLALFNAGSMIVESLTSATYFPQILQSNESPKTSSMWSTFSSHKSLLNQEETLSSPYDALSENNDIGNCWAMNGTSGLLTLKLAASTHISAVTIDHISRSEAEDIRSAPKDFNVYGFEDEVSKTQRTLLVQGTYNINGASPIQTFQSSLSHERKSFRFVSLEILSNSGKEEYTCIYRFRIHGSESTEAISG